MKLWQKESKVDQLVEKFTVGRDQEFDLQLARFDVIGSMAHAQMLSSCNLISITENEKIQEALSKIVTTIDSGNFAIDSNAEDIHSQIEFSLTQLIGDAGKKIHTARSRNDQSLLDIKLFCRDEIAKTVFQMEELFDLLLVLSEKHKDNLLPGYTHLQLAMPSSFGLWFGAYAESLCEDLDILKAAYSLADKNPLGSAAGYGSSFPIDRELTTALMGFSSMNVNSVYAQMTRGKTEKMVVTGLSSVAATLSKMAMDCTLFMNQNFGFISFPDHLTTGSSIMPHKKNPDVWELIRGKCNRIQSLPNEFALLLTNLPSGYHRELQLTKEILFPAFSEIQLCLKMTAVMLEEIKIKVDCIEDKSYELLFTVDAVNKLVKSGIPFRDAYKKIGLDVDLGLFEKPEKLEHSHIGSMGNLGNAQIFASFKGKLRDFHFEKAQDALRKLCI